jgi:tetratricopeptide (TPR) repeat protein
MRMRKPSPQILLNYGMILHALIRIDEALASFDATLKQKSGFAEAHNNRGAVLAEFGRNEEALECFRKALALKDDYADAHYNRGSSLRVLGQYDEALASLERALTLQPNQVKALDNRGAVMEALRADYHCVFLNRLSQSKFVAAAGLSDVFLDSIGWSGCNSALECLTQALPIVTFEGRQCVADIVPQSYG